jgi:diguanylate cyclase (GGDEF)-like protein
VKFTDALPPKDDLPPQTIAEPAPLRVLVAEDISVQRRMLARVLANMGHVVETAENGAEALCRILAATFDVLITDWEMPVMDGPTLCAAVRAANLERYMFIVMLTNHESVKDFVAGIGSGADVYLRKPANPLELQAHLTAGRRIIHLERELRAAKATDSLLNVYTRDYLEEQLPREVARARRYGTPLTVLMADLDRFKRVNDEHGHRVGDLALKSFCERARGSIRRSVDWMARYGGEEFVIVLPQTKLEGGLCVAEKIRALCADNPLTSPAAALTVTVSLGVADLEPGDDAKPAAAQMLHRADTALYQSKRDGRNRVTVWGAQ